MNNRLYASQRDSKILEYIELLGALNTNQIKELLFPNSLRKAQQRLTVLSKKGKVQKIRLSIDQPSIYFMEKPQQLEHIILRNWAYVWLTKKYKVTDWQTERTYGDVRCDAICKIKSPLEERWVFIEAHRGTNKLSVVEKYNKLYEKEGYVGSKIITFDKFPSILIVSQKEIPSCENTHRLSFIFLSAPSLGTLPQPYSVFLSGIR